MSDKELAPISVEVVAIDDLNSIKVIANTNTSKENNAGIGERADAFLGLASDVIDLVEGKQLYNSVNDLVLYATGAAACSTSDLLMVLENINNSLDLIEKHLNQAYFQT